MLRAGHCQRGWTGTLCDVCKDNAAWSLKVARGTFAHESCSQIAHNKKVAAKVLKSSIKTLCARDMGGMAKACLKTCEVCKPGASTLSLLYCCMCADQSLAPLSLLTRTALPACVRSNQYYGSAVRCIRLCSCARRQVLLIRPKLIAVLSKQFSTLLSLRLCAAVQV